jgi:hypothetical protein
MTSVLSPRTGRWNRTRIIGRVALAVVVVAAGCVWAAHTLVLRGVAKLWSYQTISITQMQSWYLAAASTSDHLLPLTCTSVVCPVISLSQTHIWAKVGGTY